jgi:hypothetical protein
MSDSEAKSIEKTPQNDKPWLFKPGGPGGPGRPRGESMKTTLYKSVKEILTPEEIHGMATKFLDKARENQDSWQAKAFAAWFFGPDMVDQIDAWMDRGERREQAFLSYQIHKQATDIQRKILFAQAKYMMLMAGRRGGKSEGLKLWYLDAFVQKPTSRCLYIGLTISRAMSLMWQPMMEGLAELGIKIREQSRVEGKIVTEAGGLMQFGGNTTKDEREKNRGPYWDRIAIDECQSQKELLYLVEHILSPTLIDTQGHIAFAGTGPRVRGTYWEALYLGQWADGKPLYPDALRLNWNLSQNPYVADFETALEQIRAEKSLKETDSLYIREYLGRIAYDDDALVIRLAPANAFTDEELSAWISAQPVTDVRFIGGLDFGFRDCDALGIICYSVSRPERYLVYEWKDHRKGTADIAAEVNKGIEYVKTSPLFAKVVNRTGWPIKADTGGNAITPFDLSSPPYSLPLETAYKQDKNMAVEMLQDEARKGQFKARQGGPFWDECLKTVYGRNEQDQLTREVDDETYHPDMMPAITYAMRDLWLFNNGG